MNDIWYKEWKQSNDQYLAEGIEQGFWVMVIVVGGIVLFLFALFALIGGLI